MDNYDFWSSFWKDLNKSPYDCNELAKVQVCRALKRLGVVCKKRIVDGKTQIIINSTNTINTTNPTNSTNSTKQVELVDFVGFVEKKGYIDKPTKTEDFEILDIKRVREEEK